MSLPDIVLDRRAVLKARHRESILAAANALILERGKPRFSVDELAQRADVSRRTVFNHFSSLDDVIMTTCTRVLSDVVDDFRAAAAATPPAGGSTATLFADITRALRNIDLPSVVAYLWGVLADDGGDARSQYPLGDVFTRASDQLSVEIAERNGDIDEFDVAVLLSSLMNGVAVVAGRWIAATGASLDDSSREVWNDLLDRLIAAIRVGYQPTP